MTINASKYYSEKELFIVGTDKGLSYISVSLFTTKFGFYILSLYFFSQHTSFKNPRLKTVVGGLLLNEKLALSSGPNRSENCTNSLLLGFLRFLFIQVFKIKIVQPHQIKPSNDYLTSIKVVNLSHVNKTRQTWLLKRQDFYSCMKSVVESDSSNKSILDLWFKWVTAIQSQISVWYRCVVRMGNWKTRKSITWGDWLEVTTFERNNRATKQWLYIVRIKVPTPLNINVKYSSHQHISKTHYISLRPKDEERNWHPQRTVSLERMEAH